MVGFVNKGIKIIFTFMIAVVLILMLFFQSTEYMCKVEFLYSNIVLLTGVVILLFFLWVVFHAASNFKYKLRMLPYGRIVKISAFCLLILQMYLACNICFFAGWDAGTVLKAAKTIAFGDISKLDNNYFSTYPNNIFLASVYAFILKLNRAVGIFSAKQQILSLIFVNCVFSTVSCVLIYKILCRFLNEMYAFAGFLLGVLAFGVSPWVTVYYSDSAGLLFPILLLWLYLLPADGRKRVFRYLSIVLVGIIGYSIKPQTVIILIAFVLMDFIYYIQSRDTKKIVLNCLAVLIGLILAGISFRVLDNVYEKEGFEINKEAAYGMPHFFMMGLNEERNGVFAGEDTSFSKKYKTKAERRKANLELAGERLKNFGAFGYVKHLAKKLLVTYNDGTYAWGQEGTFFKTYYDEVNTRAAPVLRGVYYPGGKYYKVWAAISQAVWLMILLLCLCSGVCVVKTENSKTEDSKNENSKNIYKSKIISILYLSIIGLTLFELLFECRARYLYTYIPIYCITSISGLYALNSRKYKIAACLRRLKDKFIREEDQLCR